MHRTNFNNSRSHRLSVTTCSSWIRQATISSVHIVSDCNFATTCMTIYLSFLNIFFKSRFRFVSGHNRNWFCNNLFITNFNYSINLFSIFYCSVRCDIPSCWVHSITSGRCFNTILTFANRFFTFDCLVRVSFITFTFRNRFCLHCRFGTKRNHCILSRDIILGSHRLMECSCIIGNIRFDFGISMVITRSRFLITQIFFFITSVCDTFMNFSNRFFNRVN